MKTVVFGVNVMHRSFLVFLVVWSFITVAHVVAAPPGKRAVPQAPQGADLQSQIDTLAQKLFTASDKNHNGVLNKGEFQQAQQALAASIDEMDRAGTIGRPHAGKGRADAQPVASPSAEKLAKSNKVSQGDFATYVQAMVQHADQQFQQVNSAAAAAAAQRKALPRRAYRYIPRSPQAPIWFGN